MATSVAQSLTGLDRFQGLWRRCLINGMPDHSATIHQQLIEAYGEPHRRYHTLAHIEHCLAMFDQSKSLARRRQAGHVQAVPDAQLEGFEGGSNLPKLWGNYVFTAK